MNGKKKSLRLMGIGLTIVLLLSFLVLFAPFITSLDPNAMSLENQFASPSAAHLFGLDENGSDVFAKVLYGGRISIGIALVVVFISLIVGLIIGSLAGFVGGLVDSVIMRFIDMLYAFPNFLLALALVAVLGPSIRNLILAMCLTSWTSYARLIRGEVLHLKEKEYVTSSRALGLHPFKLVTLHIWPNLTGPLVVHCTFAMAGTIIAESGLSFLGLGAPPSQPTWGALLSSGRQYLAEAPHISLFPGLAIILLVLGFNLFGDGLRDYLDPKN